ncbi:hypothetical protein [Pseudoclavibacter helvolus]|uniref:hypothetical protein n=1 Tax=Pseudoclavibacter helvolus TaxID=255205 RepID=UPI003C78FFC7
MNPMILVTKLRPVVVPSLPPALDATVTAMRPSGRRLAVITVAPLPGAADHTSINAAIAEGRMIQQAKMTAEGRTQATPNDRIDIIIREGSYAETVDLHDWINLYGEGSAKVTITQLNSNAKRGTFEGAHAGYIEGVRIVRSTSALAVTVYPVHSATEHTSIWVDVIFDHQTAAQSAFGSDGGDNGYTCFYRCRFVGGTNIHGSIAQNTAKTVAYIMCVGLYSLGWNAYNETSPDHIWVVGTTAASITIFGAATKLHVSGSTISGAITTNGTQDTRSDWPVPTGGLSAYDRAFYGM